MITLLSTVVAPEFAAGSLVVEPVDVKNELSILLRQVNRNLCGHPVTNQVLRGICPTLPESKREFWDGSTEGLAVRPKGGVRNAAQEGDTRVCLEDLEAALVRWVPV